MVIDTRGTREPVPCNCKDLLSVDQVLVINQYTNYGWNLWFVRRDSRRDTIPVLKNLSTGEAVIIDEDGEFVRDHDLVIRD